MEGELHGKLVYKQITSNTIGSLTVSKLVEIKLSGTVNPMKTTQSIARCFAAKDIQFSTKQYEPNMLLENKHCRIYLFKSFM